MKNIDSKELDNFLDNNQEGQEEELGKKVIIKDKSLVERINKTILVEDGRQLLM